MSNFTAQRILNTFPAWTKVRKDQSSFGHKFVSSITEFSDFFLSNILKLQNDFSLTNLGIGVGRLYSVKLAKNNHVTVDKTITNSLKYIYPTSVEGSDNEISGLNLTQCFYFENFLFYHPTRVSLSNTIAYSDTIVWDSDDPTTINDLSYFDFLYIDVSGSTVFNKRTVNQDRLFNDVALINLEGLDINNNPIKETIVIRDDGPYITKNIWSQLTSIPKAYGFDGRIKIGYKQPEASYVVDPYQIAVQADIEGPLHLFLNDIFLCYKVQEFKFGNSYKRPNAEIIDNDYIICNQVLLDDSEEEINPVDMCVNYYDGRLYVLSDDSHLHIYEHQISPFIEPETNPATTYNYIEIIPVERYAKFEETEKLWTYFSQQSKRIIKVEIKRVDPNGVVRYLQGDKTWGALSYTFDGETRAKTIQETWQDFEFETNYNVLGQWDYWITTTTENDVSVYHTSVMVDSIVALKSINLEIANLEAISFTHEGKLMTRDATNIYIFDLISDVYFIEPNYQLLLTRHKYNSIEVV